MPSALTETPGKMQTASKESIVITPHLSAYAARLKREHLNAVAQHFADEVAKAGVDLKSYLKVETDADYELAVQHLTANGLDTLVTGNMVESLKQTGTILFGANGAITTKEIKERRADVIALARARKNNYHHFLATYTDDASLMLKIVGEIEAVTVLFEEAITEKFQEQLEKSVARRESLLIEAQKFAGIGSFIWNIKTMASEVTPGMNHILDDDRPDQFDDFMSRVHPDDRAGLEQAMSEAIAKNGAVDYTYRFTTPFAEKILRTRGIVETVDGMPVLKGSVSDMTYEQALITKLEHSKAKYKEAQQMGRIGNWSFDIDKRTFRWSDEMYRIYDKQPSGKEITFDELIELIDPADISRLKDEIALTITTGKSNTSILRVITKAGTHKILEVKRTLIRDNQGRAVELFGTVQDVSTEQRLIQQLQDGASFYRQMESLAQIGNWSLDLATNEVQWSPGLFEIYGDKPTTDGKVDIEEMRERVDEVDRVITQQGIQKCIADNTPYSYKYHITLADGSRKTLRGNGEADIDDMGRTVRIFGTVQDISEHEALLEKLRLNEESLRQAQSIAHIGSGTFYVETGKSVWSDELYSIFETSRSSKLDYEFISKLLPPKDWELMELHLRRCVEGGIRFDFHTQLIFESGRNKNIRIIGEAAKREGGITKEIFCTVQDVTALKTVERRLRENQRYTQKINDVSPAVITVVDINTGEYKMVSSMAKMLFGYTPEEIIATGFSEMMGLVHPDDVARLIAENAAALARANAEYPDYLDDNIIEFRYRLQHKNGHYIWVQTSAIVFDRMEDGRVHHILNVTIDITRLMEAEEKLRLNNHALQQSNAALQEFAYIASHDLQEPLRKISTFGTMLEGLNVEGLPANGKMFLRKMIESASRMQGMVNDILSVSLISSVRSYEEVSLQDLLNDALMALEMKISQTGAKIIQEKELPAARVIESQMRQLFQNLIGNSLKFARQGVGPVITISHDVLQGEAITDVPGLEATQSYLRIKLSDNGIGFSNDYASRIFAIFQRLNGKSEYEGSGIGLAICRKIVEHHNGNISASGEVGVGATFVIALPV